MADGTITVQECERLEEQIGSNERYIARKLAYRAARDLEEMLDRGSISTSRVAYIEKAIEKGQAALLYEARDFASGRERSGFSLTHLKQGRSDFERDDEFLRTQLMRLRDYYEDWDGEDD